MMNNSFYKSQYELIEQCFKVIGFTMEVSMEDSPLSVFLSSLRVRVSIYRVVHMPDIVLSALYG